MSTKDKYACKNIIEPMCLEVWYIGKIDTKKLATFYSNLIPCFII